MAWIFSPYTKQWTPGPEHKNVYWTYPAFRAIIAECKCAYQKIHGYPFVANDEADDLTNHERDRNVRILHFMYQIALASIMQEWGILPSAIFHEESATAIALYLRHECSLHEALQTFLAGNDAPESTLLTDSTYIMHRYHDYTLLVTFDLDTHQLVALQQQIATQKTTICSLVTSESSAQSTENSSLCPLLEIIGHVYTAGHQINWSAFYADMEGSCISLPTYSWQRERLWFETPTATQPHQAENSLGDTDTASPTILLTHLLSVAKEQRKGFLLDYLTSYISHLLDLSPEQTLTETQRLFDAGIRSLTATQLSNHLQIVLGCSLSPTLLFNYPTIERLSNYLLTKVEQDLLISDQETTAKHNEDVSIDDTSHNKDEMSILLAKLDTIERDLT